MVKSVYKAFCFSCVPRFLKPGGSVSTENKELIQGGSGHLSTVQRPLNLAERKGCTDLSEAALWDEGSQAGCSHKHRWTLAYLHTVSLHATQLCKSETITPAHCHEKAVERKQWWELGIWDLRLSEAIPLKGH